MSYGSEPVTRIRSTLFKNQRSYVSLLENLDDINTLLSQVVAESSQFDPSGAQSRFPVLAMQVSDAVAEMNNIIAMWIKEGAEGIVHPLYQE